MSHIDLTTEGQPSPSPVRSNAREASNELELAWRTLSGLKSTSYNEGLKIIKWAGLLEPKLEFDTQASGLLFESPLQFRHTFDELQARMIEAQCSVSYFDGTSAYGKCDLSLGHLIQAISSSATGSYGDLRTPIIAHVTSDSRNYKSTKGLVQAGQAEATADMFGGLSTVSPCAVFSQDWSLFVSSPGALQPITIDGSFTSAIIVVTHGSQLVITFERSESNKAVMKREHTYKTTTSLLRALSGPQFLYQQPGQAVYIASGQAYLVLSLQAGASYVLDCANPSKKDWELTIRARENTFEEILEPDQTEENLRGALARVNGEIELWRRCVSRVNGEIELWRRCVSLLPDERNSDLDAISRPEGEGFLAKMTQGRDRVCDAYERVKRQNRGPELAQAAGADEAAVRLSLHT
ncbi:uncharacterized protein PAN0_003d2024 [Moesziomyces antarcticus]|uniref:uncharacterized protein n=1 Tax=Pseudozyma antarctica TaxID=84753 RepID=UPI0007198844|nr:uncharacterized protein PAN0_003d2024 [Moesziomyces antarcticus]GAK63815.1 hypothetical protein PAN0_003d2024 [Moesziomyces antarcticus]